MCLSETFNFMMPYMAISLGAESVGQGEVCEQKVWERGEVVGYT